MEQGDFPPSRNPEEPVGPPVLDGWLPPQRYDSPLAFEPQSPEADRVFAVTHRLRARYGADNVSFGPGYNDEGQEDGRYMTIYIREGVQPQGPIRRAARAIGDALLRRGNTEPTDSSAYDD